MWHEIFLAIGLVLIIEGILPMISATRYKRYLAKLNQMNDSAIRVMGIVMVIIGTVVVAVVKSLYGV